MYLKYEGDMRGLLHYYIAEIDKSVKQAMVSLQGWQLKIYAVIVSFTKIRLFEVFVNNTLLFNDRVENGWKYMKC